MTISHRDAVRANRQPQWASGPFPLQWTREQLSTDLGGIHTYGNAAADRSRYLLIITLRIRELIAVLHDPERQQGRSMAAIFEAHDSELVDSS